MALPITAPRSLDTKAFKAIFGIRLTDIGAVDENVVGGEVVVMRKGQRVDPPRGHDHFSR